nr:hypothetical protein [Tanacetum cinerariifolium]
MTTSSSNNSVFRGFFEKQKLNGPNFIDWYQQLKIALSIEDKLNYLEQPIPPALVAPKGQLVALEILAAHTAWIKGSKETTGLMLMTMEPEIQRNLENLHAHEMLQELKTLFAQQAEQELLQTMREFYSCKQKEGQSVSSYVLKMKSYIDNPERLGHPVTLGLGGLRGRRKLKPGALSLYVGNGQRATVKANGSYHLSLPSGLVIVLNNYYYDPSINRGIILVSRLYDDGYVNQFVDNLIQVSRNNMVYFSAVLWDGIFEIDLSDSYTNVSSIYALSNKRSKSNLDSALLWHCRLGHISKKLIEKLQHDGLLNSTDLRAFEKCHTPRRGLDGIRNSLITQEASGSLEDHEIIQEKDTHPSIDTSLNHKEDDLEIDEPQSDIIPIRSKWLFKKKTDMDGTVHTYKARLIAKGYTQTSGIDYEETLNPVADIRAIRILIAIATFDEYEIWQMDVKTAFINGYLSEEQAPRQWNKRFDNEIKKIGFTQNRDEPCIYLKASGSNITFLTLYVDDILIMGNNIPMLQDVKSCLGRCFAMKDLGEAAYILGIKIYRDRSRRLIGLCQSAYIEKILKRYHMENSKRGSILMQDKLRLSKLQGASTPAELKRMQNVPYALAVGSIMYAVRCTRPDVAFAQNITSRFQQNSGDLHWTTVKNILKYLTNTKDMFLVYKGVVDWKSAKQSIFATSSAEAEYIASFDASKEVVWVRKFISRLGVVHTIEEPISMYCDNTKAITIANELGITKGARHSRAKVHYLREVIEYGDVKLEKVHTYDNLANPFTKALAFQKHSEHTKNIRMLSASSLMYYASMVVSHRILGLLTRLELSNGTVRSPMKGHFVT